MRLYLLKSRYSAIRRITYILRVRHLFCMPAISIMNTFRRINRMQKNRQIKLETSSLSSSTCLRHHYQSGCANPYGNIPDLMGGKDLFCSFPLTANRTVMYTAKLCSCRVVRTPAGAPFMKQFDLSKSTVGKKVIRRINSTLLIQ